MTSWPAIFFILTVVLTFLSIYVGWKILRYRDAKPIRELNINGVPIPSPSDPRWGSTEDLRVFKCGKFTVERGYTWEGRISLGTDIIGHSKAYYAAVCENLQKQQIKKLKLFAETELVKLQITKRESK